MCHAIFWVLYCVTQFAAPDNLQAALRPLTALCCPVAPTLAFIGLLWKSLRNIQFETQVSPHPIITDVGWGPDAQLPLIAHDPGDTIACSRRVCPQYVLADLVTAGRAAAVANWLPKPQLRAGLCVQVRWVAQVLSGKAILPSEAAMMEDIHGFYTLRAEHGVPLRYTHCQVSSDTQLQCSTAVPKMPVPNLQSPWTMHQTPESCLGAVIESQRAACKPCRALPHLTYTVPACRRQACP